MEENQIDKKRTIVDKKRIAVCGGTLGRETRSYVRGQVVDIGITDITKADELWDLLTGLFQGEEEHVTPFLDFSLAPVRKPILKVTIFEKDSGKVIYTSEPFVADEDGFFSHPIHKPLPPGKYYFEVTLEGLDSYRQYSKDLAYINSHENTKFHKSSLLGRGRLRILPENYKGYVVISDIDQTYLATDLHSTTGKFAALFESASQKRALPGMPELYRRIRNDLKDAPLVFISASPHFFRRTLFATVRKHNIEFESIHLKYLQGTIKGVLDKIISTTINPIDLFSGGFRSALKRTRKFLGSSYQSLFDQMAYKLSILLQSRLHLPTQSKEILLGDNTESDYMIFTLYQLILLGDFQANELEEYLYKLNFLGKDPITRDMAKKIRNLAEENWSIHGFHNPVELALINITGYGPNEEDMLNSVKLALPGGGIRQEKYWKDKKPFYGTEGSLGFSIYLHSAGLIELNSIFHIASSMVGEWMDGNVIDGNWLIERIQNLTLDEKSEDIRKTLLEGLKKIVFS